MTPERQREIASAGGSAVKPWQRSFSKGGDLASMAGRVGGQNSGGNFKNCRERAVEAGRKGGQRSGGNFKHDPARASRCGKMAGHS